MPGNKARPVRGGTRPGQSGDMPGNKARSVRVICLGTRPGQSGGYAWEQGQVSQGDMPGDKARSVRGI